MNGNIGDAKGPRNLKERGRQLLMIVNNAQALFGDGIIQL
jgi:hypothetical protein